ncbi:DUF2971 domain-containing protein [Haladaptatus cibarius]|uniref:DUF2971 domain-containing protein n=1 Tax=Haladaptatus cibarius TaxID=453847 RepID=UPI0011850860|nr:DUF2971 domain-containing protein [Haladaptatus cibarius]
MPYEDHPRCISPRRADVKIWRYMDFTQLVSILERNSLYFHRADRFDDPYEGSLPKQNFDLRSNELDNIPDDWTKNLLPRFRQICRRYTFLNCWHINETESAGMWDLYLKADAGICIQSTYERLIDSLEPYDESNVFISKVKYIKYGEERLSGWSLQSPLADTISPFIHKRESFKHEREIRAIIHDLPWSNEGDTWITAEDIENTPLHDEGLVDKNKYIRVNLDKLIENVYIAPHAPKWIKNLVEKVLKTHGLSSELVKKSNMTEDPLY